MINALHSFEINRQPKYNDRELEVLNHFASALYKELAEVQQAYEHETLFLDKDDLLTLTHILVEFAEDLINRVGVWESLERRNKELFDTPLPYYLSPGAPMPDQPVNKIRIHYLLWNLFEKLKSGLIISPHHNDLVQLVDRVYAFFNEYPDLYKLKYSTLKSFIQSPNKEAWQVKRKLVWLGTKSYLFRLCYNDHMQDVRDYDSNNPSVDYDKNMEKVDEFVCQHFTYWSGLTAPDLLSILLPLSDQKKTELQKWEKRYYYIYKVLKNRGRRLHLLNIFNEETYAVRLNQVYKSFEKNEYVMGALGACRTYDNLLRKTWIWPYFELFFVK